MRIAIGLYPGFTALDAIGPYQVLSNVPGAEVIVCAAQKGRLDDDNGILHFDIEHTFDEVTEADVILVPGGMIPRVIARKGDPVVDWVRALHPKTTWTTSVCTGALVLGAAGVLDGLDATTHWAARDQLAALGARPVEQRVVIQGKVI